MLHYNLFKGADGRPLMSVRQTGPFERRREATPARPAVGRYPARRGTMMFGTITCTG